jgi:hypothetical protein
MSFMKPSTLRLAVLASCAFWHALELFFRGDLAPAKGWVARGGRILEGGHEECVEQAWLLMLTALPLLFEGEAESAQPSFVEAAEIAVRFGDVDATTFARLGQGHALILHGRIPEGIALPRSWSPSRQTRCHRCWRGSPTAR